MAGAGQPADSLGPGRGAGSILQRRFGVVYPQVQYPFAGVAADPPVQADDKVPIPPPKWLYPKVAAKFGFIAPVDRQRYPQDLPPTGQSAQPLGRDDTRIPPPLWLRPLIGPKFGFIPPGGRFQPGTETQPPPPPTSGTGSRGIPLVIRDPMMDSRIRRHTEAVAGILNSLLLRGYIIQTDNDVWEHANRFWNETRVPTVFDDEIDGVRVGDFWFDASTGNLYVNQTNGPGVAVWVLIGGSGPGGGGLTGTFP